MTNFLVLGLALALSGCASGNSETLSRDVANTTRSSAMSMTAGARENALRAAIENPTRSAENRARDEFRHPVETLLFLGIDPNQVVVEVWPGGGWYTEILAPYLADNGLLVAGSFRATEDPENYRTKIRGKFDARVATDPAFSKVVNGTLDPPILIDIGAPESADAVLTFRNIHNFMKSGTLDDLFSSAYTVLKPGGTLGVVEHRATPGTDLESMIKSGYVTQAYVIKTAEHHGFELVETSEINSNKKDTKDHPEGVWTLPPSLRLGEVDKDKYLSIGESDRMTLKFRRPLKPKTTAK
jgi:predicted methyltransferase